MTYLGDAPFRMPDSYYDPPEPEVWTCKECGTPGQETDECDECEATYPDAALDPYEAYQDMLAEEADNARDDWAWEGRDD